MNSISSFLIVVKSKIYQTNGSVTPPPSSAAIVAHKTLSALSSQMTTPSVPVPAACNLSPLLEETKEQAIKNRDGHLWQCVDRIRVKEGFIYKFKLRKEFDTSEGKKNDQREHAAEEKNREITPAVERRVEQLTPRNGWRWDIYHNGSKVQGENEHTLKRRLVRGKVNAVSVPFTMNPEDNKVLMSVGYKMEITKEGITLDLPDGQVLQSRWNKMVENHQVRNLKTLTIVSSQDIATDEEFTKAYIEKKMILSNGSEFAHDHQVHLLPTLILMLEAPERYCRAREKFSRNVAGIVDLIKTVRKSILENSDKDVPNLEREDYERLKKNMVLADAIPGIAADNLAAVCNGFFISQFEDWKGLWRWRDIVCFNEDFIKKRHEREISEKYQKEHNGAAIPPAELAAQMEGISLSWLFDTLVTVLGK